MKNKVLKYLVFSSLLAGIAFAEVELPLPQGFINDYAGMLSPAQKQELEVLAQSLKEKSGAELAVAIVKSVEPLDPKLYAVKLFEKWRIGEKGKDNGLLILLAMEQRRIEVEVGYGLEGVLPDSRVGMILDQHAVPYFKQGDFAAGIIETAKAFSQIVLKGESAPLSGTRAASENDFSYLIYAIVIMLILGVILKNFGSVVMGIFGAIWGYSYAQSFLGAMIGGILGFLLGFWGRRATKGMGGKWGGDFGGWGFGGGGGGFGGFGGGRSGGGGGGRSW